MIYELIADYGMVVIPFLAGALGWLLFKAADLIDSITFRSYAKLAIEEVVAAVREVAVKYVGELKEFNADGKLTDEEKDEAKRRAISLAKSNLGKKGLARLAKRVNVDSWIGNKIEAVIDEDKRLGKP